MKTVFALEDDPTLRAFLRRALPRLGYRCEAFETVEELLDRCRESRPDALLCDVGCGAGDGISAALEAECLWPGLRVAFMTGNPFDAERAARSGLGPVLMKPFSLEELRESLG